jgi:hypothetical protein
MRTEIPEVGWSIIYPQKMVRFKHSNELYKKEVNATYQLYQHQTLIYFYLRFI